jgi:peptidoglycan/xylan/chitin deacetylase (PgdA/CDA1 family)
MTNAALAPSTSRPRRRWLPWTLAGLAALLVVAAALWQVSRARCFALVGSALCRVQTAKPLVALTFDDGPTAEGVQSILPELTARRAHATFFLIGGEVEKQPELAQALVVAGHEIANHSYSHVRMVGHSQAFYRGEIDRTDALLRAAGGTSSLFRPPYGKKLLGLPIALQDRHRQMVMWDVEDPATRDPAEFARSVIAQARPGSIILLHAMYRPNDTARRALPLILDGLAAKGLRPVSVGELLRATGQGG